MKRSTKTSLTKLGSLLLLTLFAFSARAYVVLQDNFTYPDGSLTNSTGDIWTAGPGDATGPIQILSGSLVIPGVANSGQDFPRTYFTNGIAGNVVGFTINAPVPTPAVYFFPSNAPVAALYYSLTMSQSSLPSGETYFAYLQDTNYDFRARLLVTNSPTSGSSYRLAIANNASTSTNILPVDLSLNTQYNVVVRYVLSTGISTMWVTQSPAAPASESDSAATEVVTGNGAIGLGGNTNSSTCGFGLRNSAVIGTITLNNLIVGTAFGDVVPSSVGSNPPFIVTQPLDNISAIVGDTVTYSTLVGGDTNLTYQWYYNTNSLLAGQTNLTLTLTGVTTGSSGTYSCIASNSAGTKTTRFALLTVYTSSVAPSISAQPANVSANVGDTVSFSVTAAALPPPTYQWSYVTNSAGSLKTNVIAGATLATFNLFNVSNNVSGNSYFVTVANRAGTNLTAPATLTVSPVQSVTIASLNSMVDGNYAPTNLTSIFSATGIVTTWTNMTGVANTEFYMQDGTAGICVFWSGANSTNRPPAGAMVKVTGPLAAFSGLLEIEPVFTNGQESVKILSTNNPLPVAQAVPFDPNVSFAQLKSLQGMYCVASNVTLAAGTAFGSGVNENVVNNNNIVLTDPIPGFSFTNTAGQTFDLFINASVGIGSQPKPSGPVTVYGIMGIFNGTFELTPSRYADIISYTHVTNVLTHIVRPGDAPTNAYSEMALPPGETLTTSASIGDAAGGTVTLTPLTTGLPASASWSNITSGLTATATFSFTPTAGDAGSNYVVSLMGSSTSGSTFTNIINVYVPTPDEQHMAITEFLVNPATNSALPLFNPLGRALDVTAIAANDQYVEVANQSPNGFDMQGGIGWDIDSGNPLVPLENFDASSDIFLSSSNAFVVYGATTSGNSSPNLPVQNVPASAGGLSLPKTGTGVIILRNGTGNIVDRVVYNAGTLPTNCAMSRFPTLNSAFVPQSFISTNVATPGLQYDGGSWTAPTKVPTGLAATLSVTNNQAFIKFSADTTQANTLWQTPSLLTPFQVINGTEFGTTSGVFSVTNLSTAGFYFITTQ